MRRSKLFVGIFWVFLNSSAKITITNQITADWSMMGRKISQKSNKTYWIDSTKPKFPSMFRSDFHLIFFFKEFHSIRAQVLKIKKINRKIFWFHQFCSLQRVSCLIARFEYNQIWVKYTRTWEMPKLFQFTISVSSSFGFTF